MRIYRTKDKEFANWILGQGVELANANIRGLSERESLRATPAINPYDPKVPLSEVRKWAFGVETPQELENHPDAEFAFEDPYGLVNYAAQTFRSEQRNK